MGGGQAARGGLSEEIEAVLTRALAPTPDARFPDARSMAQAIERLRDHGEHIATGDDLAEAVRDAQRSLPPPGRKVIALSSVPAEPGPDSVEGPSELARTAAPGGVGAFTLRFPTRQVDGASEPARASPDRWSAPEPRTERIAPVESPPSSGAPALVSDEPGAPVPGARESHEAIEQDAPAAPGADEPRRRALRRGAIAAVLGAALLGVVAFVTNAPRRTQAIVLAPPPPSPSLLRAAPGGDLRAGGPRP